MCVIPAPIAYIEAVAVKKLVVGLALIKLEIQAVSIGLQSSEICHCGLACRTLRVEDFGRMRVWYVTK
jgi:hypothetical protein